MNFQIITTPNFLRQFKPLEKKYRSIVNDLISLQASLSASPMQGIPLGHDCFKVRMAITAKNRGRSGGARVITCIKVVNRKVYLVGIFDKSERENIPTWRITQMLREAGLDKL